MAKNLKTVRHRFNYRQCDTFAAYLNHMARQGWHFKEFRSKLVFEKGEPEDAVYAVEIFTDGTAHDMQPSYKAMNFAEYCEVAGWQFVDQRANWYVLKRVREDALPIFADEERYENIKRVSYPINSKLTWLWLLMVFLQGWLLFTEPRAFLFKPSSQYLLLYWVLKACEETFRSIEYRRWCKNCEAKLDRGEPLYFHRRKNLAELSSTIPLALLGLHFIGPEIISIRPLWIITGIFIGIVLIMTYLPSQRRMDADTSQVISVLLIVVYIFYLFSIFFIIAIHSDTKPEPEPPIPISVFRPEVEDADVSMYQDTTVFGSRYTCRMHTEDNQVSYYIYKSKYDWVLDAVWNQELEHGLPLIREDWDALDAVRTEEGRYAIRYEDRILILIPGPELLSQTQIDSIIAALRGG